MLKISIIVPIYNTEKYIEKCLESLANQTLKDIEIICVNDGSTDNSMILVRTFANKDSRIKIIEQTHQKQGVARNRGTEIATGEYIGFVDSDDWVDLDYFEKLYNAAKKYDSDIALATNVRVGNGKTKKRIHIEKEEFVTNLQDKFNATKQAKNPCPTNKIYRAEMLKKNNVTWPEGCYFEDKLFTVKAVYYANGIVTVPNIYYYYFRNPNSTVKRLTKQHSKVFNDNKNKARLDVLNFLREVQAPIRDIDFFALKSEIKLLGILLYKTKISLFTEKHYLFGIIPIFQRKLNETVKKNI